MTPGSGWSRNLTPAEVSARRVELSLDLDADDVSDESSWTVAGQPITAWQRRQLSRATEEEWQRAADLDALDLDRLKQLQRVEIRRRNGRNEENQP